MGGYGLKAFLITQDIRQIVSEYGQNESIVSNCQIRVAYAPNQYDTAELLSNLSGTMTIERATVNYSGDRTAAVMKHANTSIQYEERPLIIPDEVMPAKACTKERLWLETKNRRDRRHADFHVRYEAHLRHSDALLHGPGSKRAGRSTAAYEVLPAPAPRQHRERARDRFRERRGLRSGRSFQ